MATAFLLEIDTVQTIPVLTIARKGTERCPAIFFISGFGGSKKDGLRLGISSPARVFLCRLRRLAAWPAL